MFIVVDWYEVNTVGKKWHWDKKKIPFPGLFMLNTDTILPSNSLSLKYFAGGIKSYGHFNFWSKIALKVTLLSDK